MAEAIAQEVKTPITLRGLFGILCRNKSARFERIGIVSPPEIVDALMRKKNAPAEGEEGVTENRFHGMVEKHSFFVFQQNTDQFAAVERRQAREGVEVGMDNKQTSQGGVQYVRVNSVGDPEYAHASNSVAAYIKNDDEDCTCLWYLCIQKQGETLAVDDEGQRRNGFYWAEGPDRGRRLTADEVTEMKTFFSDPENKREKEYQEERFGIVQPVRWRTPRLDNVIEAKVSIPGEPTRFYIVTDRTPPPVPKKLYDKCLSDRQNRLDEKERRDAERKEAAKAKREAEKAAKQAEKATAAPGRKGYEAKPKKPVKK